MGHKDRSSEILKVHIDDSEYMSDCMHFLNSLSKKTATYKYAFFKSILDNLFNVNDKYELSFDLLSYSFSKMYWNLIAKYKLPQYQNGKVSLIEKSIYNIISYDNLVDEVDFDSLNDKVKNQYLIETKHVIGINVVGALCSDLNSTIYGFSKDTKMIWFNKDSYEFLIKYKSALEKLNYYAWILWMENNLNIANKEAANLASKLDNSTKRESLEVFKNSLFESGDKLECFYCGKEISLKGCHMDHFIPWSFVKDDQVWNLVFSCSKCNESKNNKIPNNKYLDKLINRNKTILKEDYKERINKLYVAALHNGFILWDR
ncbi:MAG: HNH endonuclease [Acholeplasmatales bacterium]|nr:HNH endonuclease [Acholeplasmatales bacterium]